MITHFDTLKETCGKRSDYKKLQMHLLYSIFSEIFPVRHMQKDEYLVNGIVIDRN
jgi:hypothetical protein